MIPGGPGILDGLGILDDQYDYADGYACPVDPAEAAQCDSCQ